ncbi:MAG: APC family permease, partial [Chthoniobacterales bacterium]
ANPVVRVVAMFLVYAALAMINIRSVRAGAGAVELVTLAKLLPLLLFVGAGIFFMHPANLGWPSWPGSHSLGDTILRLIFAFVGIEVALIPSGEVKNPVRTVPRAIYMALAITTALYLLIQLVAQGTLGADLANHPNTPLAEAAAQFLGNTGRTILVLGATISAFGFITSDILSSPRMLFALGRDGVLPPWFAHVHKRYHSPDSAIVVYAALAFLLSISSSFEGLVVLSDVAVLLMYLLCCSAVWPLLRSGGQPGQKPLAFPGMQFVPGFAVAAILWLFWLTQPWDKFAKIGAILLVGSIVYFIRKKFPTKHG